MPRDVGFGVTMLLKRCLEKDRRRRIGDMSTVRFVLDEPWVTTRDMPQARQRIWSSRRVAFAATLIILLTAAMTSGISWMLRPSTAPPKVTRLSLPLPPGQRFAPGIARRVLAISPDGERVAYVTADNRLFVRALFDAEPRQVGSDVGALPVFSPDGNSIAFTTRDFAVKRTAVSGGAPLTLAMTDNAPFGLAWANGYIFLSQGVRLVRVSENGGKLEQLLTLTDSEERAEGPQLLPDGRTVLFSLAKGIAPDRWDHAQLVAQSLATGERKVVLEGGADVRVLPTGHIMYSVGGVLFAVPFDARRLQTRGAPVPVVEGVRRVSGGNNPAMPQYDVSSNGTLVYISGPVNSSSTQQILGLSDRKGAVESLKLPSAVYQFPRLSPDSKRIVYGTDDGREAAIWVSELVGDRAPLRITYQGRNRFPIWSRDGRWILFQSDRDGDLAIFRQPADGTGTAERLTKPDAGVAHVPDVWSPTADMFLFDAISTSSYSLFQFSMQEKRAAPVGTVRSTNPITPAFSPDGRWIAYSARPAAEQPRNSLYVEPWPLTGAKYQITDDDGHHPAWGSNGKELFFIRRPGQFTVVPISTTPTFSFGAAVDLPRAFITAASGAVAARTYDMDPRSNRIVGVFNPLQADSSAAPDNRIEVVLNWFEELKARAPVK